MRRHMQLETSEKLFNNFVLKFGRLNRILHDQGKEFENKLFDWLEKYFKNKEVERHTSPYVQRHSLAIKLCSHANASHIIRKIEV